MDCVMITICIILAVLALSLYSFTKGWDEGYKQRQTEERIEKLEKKILEILSDKNGE